MSFCIKDWKVTPKRNRSELGLPLSLEQKIDVFLERTEGWQLEIADRIINGVVDGNGRKIDPSDSAYAVLQIVFSYFETIGRFRGGDVSRRESRRYFKEGLKSVFPIMNAHPDIRDALYSDVRCGLYHSGWTNPSVFISSDLKAAIGFTKQGRLLVNPRILVLKLREHLRFYVEMLRDPNNKIERERFERRFDFLNKIQ